VDSLGSYPSCSSGGLEETKAWFYKEKQVKNQTK
jgi:hypothetical protein